jgi:hypothetical protein
VDLTFLAVPSFKSWVSEEMMMSRNKVIKIMLRKP